MSANGLPEQKMAGDGKKGDNGKKPDDNPYGFLNPKHAKPRVQKMKWDVENDRKLLLLGLGREIVPKEHQKIAESFPEKPTKKSIQERLNKLRQEQIKALDKLDLTSPSTDYGHTVDDGDEDEDGSSLRPQRKKARLTEPGQESMIRPMQQSAPQHLYTAQPAIHPALSVGQAERDAAEALMAMSRSNPTAETNRLKYGSVTPAGTPAAISGFTAVNTPAIAPSQTPSASTASRPLSGLPGVYGQARSPSTPSLDALAQLSRRARETSERHKLQMQARAAEAVKAEKDGENAGGE